MKSLLVVLVLSVLVVGSTCFSCGRDDFESFKKQYNKQYATQNEDNYRFIIFCRNALRAHNLNQEVRGDENVEFGITKFSDLTEEEFSDRYLGYKHQPLKFEPEDGALNLPKITTPSTFDWRDKKVVTPVYNQETCEGCWAFSAAENIESQWAIAGKGLTELSMQQIIDCDTSSNGCNKGNTPSAYSYVASAGGIEAYNTYPFTGENGKCAFSASKIVAKISGFEYAGQNDESAMVDYLAQKGPISICVNTTNWSAYKSGVFPASQCGTALDHCVLAVGYDLNQKYWIVRNSWGDTWGQGGYIYLEYGKNACGITDVPTNAKIET